MTYDNDGRLRSDEELRNNGLRSNGSLRERRGSGAWLIGAFAVLFLVAATLFLLPAANTNNASNNNSSTVSSPARAPATTTGSGTTTPLPAGPRSEQR